MYCLDPTTKALTPITSCDMKLVAFWYRHHRARLRLVGRLQHTYLLAIAGF